MNIIGDWKASALVINDSISKVDLSPVRLNILKNSRYFYTNNIGQLEAGTFIVSDSLFITTDTTKNPAVENAVHIIKADNDSLAIRMNINQKESVMYFVH